MNNHLYGTLPISKYDKPHVQLLHDYVNYLNNHNFIYGALLFGEPLFNPDNGFVTVDVRFNVDDYYVDAAGKEMTYRRTNVQDIVDQGWFLVHSPDNSPESVCKALWEQNAFLLDEGTYTLVPIDSEGLETVLAPGAILPGEVQEYRLTMLPNHLLLEGEVVVKVVGSLGVLDTTITQTMDLIDYYQANTGKYPIERLLKRYTLSATSEQSRGFGCDKEPDWDVLLEILQTTDPAWMYKSAPDPLNLFGFEVVYQGLPTDTYPAIGNDPYVLYFNLSSEYCTAVEGVIGIGYRADRLNPPIFRN